jgi:hypothetical protein
MESRRSTRAWADIVAMYQPLVEGRNWASQPMLDLVRHLAGSRYASALFPCTSHGTLLIGRTPNFAQGDGELQIAFDGNAQRFTFTYIQAPNDSHPWSRDCEANEWPHTLERVLHKRLHWFHEG